MIHPPDANLVAKLGSRMKPLLAQTENKLTDPKDEGLAPALVGVNPCIEALVWKHCFP